MALVWSVPLQYSDSYQPDRTKEVVIRQGGEDVIYISTMKIVCWIWLPLIADQTGKTLDASQHRFRSIADAEFNVMKLKP